jgi:hypothetical protein
MSNTLAHTTYIGSTCASRKSTGIPESSCNKVKGRDGM